MGLIQHNTDEGQRLLETPSKMLMKAVMLLYPAAHGWAVMLCLAAVGYRQRMLRYEGVTPCVVCCGCHQPVVRCCCDILQPRIYGWAIVILVRLGCWI